MKAVSTAQHVDKRRVGVFRLRARKYPRKYPLVEEYYPAFKAHLLAQGTDLPGYVQQEFEDYLKCGRLEHGFLRVRCDTCHAEHLVAFSCCPQQETIWSSRSASDKSRDG
jgi:hypothetical protein